MRLLPDTNVLVYETVEDSSHHVEACKLLDSAEEVFIPSIIAHEYFWVMIKLGVSLDVILSKIEEYLEDSRTRYFMEPIDVYRKAVTMIQEDKASPREVNDYLILAVAYRERLVLATYDYNLRRAAVRRGIKVAP